MERARAARYLARAVYIELCETPLQGFAGAASGRGVAVAVRLFRDNQRWHRLARTLLPVVLSEADHPKS